jgi:hypothetical protein
MSRSILWLPIAIGCCVELLGLHTYFTKLIINVIFLSYVFTDTAISNSFNVDRSV